MDLNEFKKKWDGAEPDKMEDDELLAYKNDCFAMYEHYGFTKRFDSPYDEGKEHHNVSHPRMNSWACHEPTHL